MYYPGRRRDRGPGPLHDPRRGGRFHAVPGAAEQRAHRAGSLRHRHARLHRRARLHGKYPLVVLSPGFDRSAHDPHLVATDLASHGYVVALVGHTYEDSGETLANGQTPPVRDLRGQPDRPRLGTVTASRALDISFVLDQLTHGDRAWHLADLIDKHRIGMAGHSIGGAATVDTMIADSRVRAGVNLDGTFFPVPDAGQITRPYLMMGHDPAQDPTWTQTYANLGGYKRWLTVSGSNHATFTDIPLLAGQAGIPEPPGIDPLRGMVITREYVTAFFDQALKGIHRPCSTAPPPDNPDVLFQY